MAAITITKENFEKEVMNSDKPVLIVMFVIAVFCMYNKRQMRLQSV